MIRRHVRWVPVALAIPLLQAQASIKSDAPECAMQTIRLKRTTYIEEYMPSYFAKVWADGRYMGYIANSSNIIMDLNDPDTRVIVPGPFDPVPAPLNKKTGKVEHVSVPNGGMSFYDMNEVTKAMVPGKTTNLKDSLKHVHRDESSMANYQSLGILPGSDPEQPTYRVLSGSLRIDDYDTQTMPWTRKQSKEPICGDAGDFQLPMLSKDGQEVSAYDKRTGTTKIMKINPDGTCTQKLDLGFATGKVEFSFDGKAIAFHIDSYDAQDPGAPFSGVGARLTKNVYLLNLVRNGDEIKAGTLKKLTNNVNAGEGSYYPSFTTKGDVVYVHGEKGDKDNVRYSFRTIDPKGIEETDVFYNTACKTETAAQFALGSLWSQVCSNLSGQLSTTDAALWSLSLDPQGCRELVRKKWDEMKASITADERLLRSGRFEKSDLDAVTLSALEAACPSGNKQIGAPGKVLAPRTVGAAVLPPENLTPEQIFEAKCRSCHVGGEASKMVWNELDVDTINNALIAITSGAMPREHIANRDGFMRPLVDALLEKRAKLEANNEQ